MKIFRQHRDEPPEPPKVDTTLLANRVHMLAGLDMVLARLAAERPGDCDAVASAGIAWLATGNSTVLQGAAACTALRRAGWLLTAPVARAAADLAAQESAETQWEYTRWYRVLDGDGDLWCETSDQREAADALIDAEGGKLQRLQEHRETRWVDAESPGSGPEVVAAAERENAAERAASDIPDDWAQ